MPVTRVPAGLVRTRVTVHIARTSAPLALASPRKVACGLASAPVGQPAPHQPSLMQAARPLYSMLFTPTAPGATVMPTELKPGTQTSPWRNVLIGGIG